MKETYENDTVAQREALINEFKGNLFEFLVAKNLALEFGIYDQFITSFIQDVQKQKYFQQYESWLRLHAPEVIESLPHLSQVLSSDLCLYLGETLNIIPSKIVLVGKSFDNKQDYSNEADIIIYDNKLNIYPLSIKLCKKGSYVNTKSAGVGSFLKKYFSPFKDALFHQEELNQILDTSYIEMGQQLYEQFDLVFNGQFGKEWIEKGMSELPGQLDEHSRSIVHASYSPVIQKIYKSMEQFNNTNPLLFTTCLQSLLGYSKANIIQALCFHGGTETYCFDRTIIESQSNLLNELSQVSLNPLVADKASFELQLKNSILQIRVKPMNKFTSKSHKINCSYKRYFVS
jgi:hypothetical protein